MDLEELLRDARDGQRGAWDRLIPPLSRQLRGFFSKSGFAQADAEDLAQNTVTAISQQLPGFVPRVTLRAWVFGIARNQIRLEFRRRDRWARAIAVVLGEVRSPPTNPSSLIHALRVLERLFEELEDFPEHYRTIIENDLADGDIAEFARREGIEGASARTRRRRALAKLRARVLEWGKLAEADKPPNPASSPPSSSSTSTTLSSLA